MKTNPCFARPPANWTASWRALRCVRPMDHGGVHQASTGEWWSTPRTQEDRLGPARHDPPKVAASPADDLWSGEFTTRQNGSARFVDVRGSDLLAQLQRLIGSPAEDPS